MKRVNLLFKNLLYLRIRFTFILFYSYHALADIYVAREAAVTYYRSYSPNFLVLKL